MQEWGRGTDTIRVAEVQFRTDSSNPNRQNRTDGSVQFQFSLAMDSAGSVLGSQILKFLRTGFEPVRTELLHMNLPMFWAENEVRKVKILTVLRLQVTTEN